MANPAFIPGRILSRGFFDEAAAPILTRRFPDLRYSAGLLGYGSDVLGYDDEVSADHMWGPRFYLFLREEELELQPVIMEAFSRELPRTYRGYSVHFSPSSGNGGIRAMAPLTEGPLRPLIFIDTIDRFLQKELGTADTAHFELRRWLAVSEQRLLSLARADIYHDDLDLAVRLAPLHAYPPEVRLYLIASQWSIIASEQAFSRRCSQRGDELGSRIICARVAERLMRLCFLYCGEYAPYAKWFGTAFARLPVAAVREAITAALAANDGAARERYLVRAQALVAEMHNQSGLTPPVPYSVENYHERDIKVIFAEKFAEAAAAQLRGSPLAGLPLIGAISDLGGLCEAADHPESPATLGKLMGLYQSL